MKIAVIDANYSDQKFSGLSKTWFQWEAQRYGATITDPAAADVLAITAAAPDSAPQIRTAIKKYWNKRATIIAGGGLSASPATMEDMVDAVCVGEGRNFVRTLVRDGVNAARELPECWNKGDTREVVPSGEFPWDVPPMLHPDGTIRVFGARGCRGRCLFCQTGWEMRYQENPNPGALRRQCQTLTKAGKKIAIVTNDGTIPSLSPVVKQEFVSVRLRSLRDIWPVDRRRIRGVRIGVEGVSERLRAGVRKPFSNQELLARTVELLAAGVGVRWFFVVGLPGEEAVDYEELKAHVKGLGQLTRGCVMMNFHAFGPKPAAPLGVLPLRDVYWENFKDFTNWFFKGPGFTRRVQIVNPGMYPTRLKKSMLNMTATEEELRRGWLDEPNRNWRVRRNGSPEAMRKLARKYAAELGIAL
jgi:hypothetical protein